MKQANDLISILEEFAGKKAMVIGDVMVDAYILGETRRISPEGPVPVLNVQQREYRLGGAANVALNLQSLGAEVMLCSVIGDDDYASVFKKLLQKHQLNHALILQDKSRKTTHKTRLLARGQQLLRVDDESTHFLSDEIENHFNLQCAESLAAFRPDILIFQDYDKGVLTHNIIKNISRKADEAGIIISVDPKMRSFFDYKDISLFKPNLKELTEALGEQINAADKDSLETACKHLIKKTNAKRLLITLSAKGMYAFEENKGKIIAPENIVQVSDVSGAGDTVLSIVSLGLVCKASLCDCARLANFAGGLVCEKSGVVSVDINELKRLLNKLE